MKQIFNLFSLSIILFLLIFYSCKSNENNNEIKKDPTVLPLVLTNKLLDVTKSSAICGGLILDSIDYQVTARGVCWSETSNPTIDNNKTIDGSGSGNYISKITGLTENREYYVRSYAVNKLGISYGEEIRFVTASIEDIDGNGYHTVKVGDQEWIIENLKTKKYNDGTFITKFNNPSVWANSTNPGYGWFANDSVKYGEAYGALYNWYAVNTGKLAPKGWHVATNNDWLKLIDYVNNNRGNSVTLSKALASKNYWKISGNSGSIGCNLDINNSSGCGYISVIYQSYEDLNIAGYWWTPTDFNGGAYAAHVQLVGASTIVNTYFDSFDMFKPKMSGMSVRCIKDSL